MRLPDSNRDAADSTLREGDYFPEGHLCVWYRQNKNTEKSIWCFARAGVVPIRESYEYLVTKFKIETVICIDGGVDGIFRGDEWDLGTPSMDSISVIATSLCKAPRRIYACTAFGTEGAEGEVSHAQALNRMANLVAQDAMLGVGTILGRSKTGREFYDAVETIHGWLAPLKQSVIVSSILASMRGSYGPTVVHEKTRDRPPWISPLTSLIWYFDAEAVAKMKLFYEESLGSTTVSEVAGALEEARKKAGVIAHESIPI